MRTLNPHIKRTLDLLPLLVFFLGFKWLGLLAATTGLIAITAFSLAVTYWVERRIALAPLITAVVVGIFGGLTLWFKDETFIKIKPTLINLIFAGILLAGCAFKRGLLKSIFDGTFTLSARGWWLLSLRWGIFFLCMAALNECVWRNFPTATWVNFKVFGLIGLTLVFALAQTGFIVRHSEK